ncbi:MAG: T9SS type A sorting domain-containing protein [Dysgonamonadaceae bacterium]|jgi:hypothetical protein|nr:T9SS type A sorting domain-containing protein [Dysgonamonadaceae bacterium]
MRKKLSFLIACAFVAGNIFAQGIYKGNSGEKTASPLEGFKIDASVGKPEKPANIQYKWQNGILMADVVKTPAFSRDGKVGFKPVKKQTGSIDGVSFADAAKSPAPSDKARIIFQTESKERRDYSGYAINGFVMIIDEDPLEISRGIENLINDASYKIPENAIGSSATPASIDKETVIEIPGGIYNWLILIPLCETESGWGKPGPYDLNNLETGFEFKNGYTYVFHTTTDATYGFRVDLYEIPEHGTLNLKLPYYAPVSYDEYYYYWEVVNVNGDGTTWQPVAEIDNRGNSGMVYNCTDIPANDWLVSTAITMPAGESNISFLLASGGGDITINVYYGLTNKPEEMTLLGSLPHYTTVPWTFNHFGINIPEAGKYYFAFQIITEPWQGFAALRDVRIEAGPYVPRPDLRIYSILISKEGCAGSSEETIGYAIENVGDAPNTDPFSIIYSVGGVAGMEDFDVVVEPNRLVPAYYDIVEKVYLNSKFDLSAIRTYAIYSTISLHTTNELPSNTDKNHFYYYNTKAPTELPFENTLREEADMLWWHPATEGGWIWYPEAIASYGYGFIGPGATDLPIYSNCMQMEPGVYELNFTYLAGYGNGMVTDNFEIIFGESDRDFSQWQLVGDFKGAYNIGDTPAEGRIILPVSKAGTYRIAVTSTSFVAFYFGKIAIHKISDGSDVAIVNYTREKYAEIPLNQLTNNTYEIKFDVANAGADKQEDVGVTLSVNNTPTTKNITLEAGEIKEVKFSVPVQKDQTYTFIAFVEGNNDNDPSNDMIDPFTVKIGSAFATETVSEPVSIIGFYSPNSLGNTYTLRKQGKLTGIISMFDYSTDLSGIEMLVEVFKVKENLYKKCEVEKTPLISMPVRRPQGGLVTWQLPEALILDAGTYFFSIAQLNETSIQIVNDLNPSGSFWQPQWMNPSMLEIESRIGNVVLRADFDPTFVGVPSVAVNDIKVYAENKSLRINASSPIYQVKVYDLRGNTLYSSPAGLNAESHVVNTGSWASGIYLTRVATGNEIKTFKFIVE